MHILIYYAFLVFYILYVQLHSLKILHSAFIICSNNFRCLHLFVKNVLHLFVRLNFYLFQVMSS